MRKRFAAAFLALALALAPAGLWAQFDSLSLQSAVDSAPLKVNEEGQAARLPPLPAGMTLDMIRRGDSLFHGPGGCFVCHGVEAESRPGAGDALTTALTYVPYRWDSIDSLINHGIPDDITRSGLSMPARGARSNLDSLQVREVSAYVWAISQTRGEPWPGGHASHFAMVPVGASSGTDAAYAGGGAANPGQPGTGTSSTGAGRQAMAITWSLVGVSLLVLLVINFEVIKPRRSRKT